MNRHWRQQASCAGFDTEMFFPKPGHSVHPMIKKACANCPVKAECLEFALEGRQELVGFWAGTTGADRRTLRGLAGATMKGW